MRPAPEPRSPGCVVHHCVDRVSSRLRRPEAAVAEGTTEPEPHVRGRRRVRVGVRHGERQSPRENQCVRGVGRTDMGTRQDRQGSGGRDGGQAGEWRGRR